MTDGNIAGELDGMVAMVTGGASPIGRAICDRLAAAGAQPVICEHSADDGQHPYPWVRMDVRDRSSVRAGIDWVCDRYRRLDIVVSSAALSGPGTEASFLEHPDEMIRGIIDTNLVGAFYVLQEAARTMVSQQSGGRLVTISSISGLVAEGQASAYTASKAGLIGLTRVAALELAKHGITVNSVAPGRVLPSVPYEHSFVDTVAAAGDDTPVLAAAPGDVGDAVAFLASPRAKWVNGITVRVDGGQLLGTFPRTPPE